MNTRVLLQLKKSLNFSPAIFASRPARRIVSVVPSQTELLHYLGLNEEVVGITKFCIHPATWFRQKNRVGGTKKLHLDTIRSLKPDLVVANREENVKEEIEALAKDFPVYTSDITGLPDALDMIRDLGRITGTPERAEELALAIEQNFALLEPANPVRKVAYLIWREPYMAAGGGTFIHDMLNRCGWENIFAGTERYPETTLNFLRESGCETVLLSSEPYPFGKVHAAELSAQLPGVKVVLVNGEMFSWYGSRLLLAPGYFGTLQTR